MDSAAQPAVTRVPALAPTRTCETRAEELEALRLAANIPVGFAPERHVRYVKGRPTVAGIETLPAAAGFVLVAMFPWFANLYGAQTAVQQSQQTAAQQAAGNNKEPSAVFSVAVLQC